MAYYASHAHGHWEFLSVQLKPVELQERSAANFSKNSSNRLVTLRSR